MSSTHGSDAEGASDQFSDVFAEDYASDQYSDVFAEEEVPDVSAKEDALFIHYDGPTKEVGDGMSSPSQMGSQSSTPELEVGSEVSYPLDEHKSLLKFVTQSPIRIPAYPTGFHLPVREVYVRDCGPRTVVELPSNWKDLGIELVRYAEDTELEHACVFCNMWCFKPTAASCCGIVACYRCICREIHQNKKKCPVCGTKLRKRGLVNLRVTDMWCLACKEWMPFIEPVAAIKCGHVVCGDCMQHRCPICRKQVHSTEVLSLKMVDPSTVHVRFLDMALVTQ